MRKIIILFVVLSSIVSYGQESRFLVHFNNAQDRDTKKNSIEALIDFEKFRTVASQTSNSTTRIHAVFYDPSVQGILEVDQGGALTAEEYLKEWINKYESYDKRILFFFVKNNDAYTFHSLYVTPNLVQGQLPSLVIDFIRDQIIKKETTLEKMIIEGVNAFKNAFDPQFKNRLVENAATLFDNSKYYKGYSCIDYDYYFFERVPNSNIQQAGCNPLYFDNDNKIVVPYSPPANFVDPAMQSVVMDHFAEKPLAYRNINTITGAQQADIRIENGQITNLRHYDGTKFESLQALNYTYNYFDFAEPATRYTGINDTRIPSAMKSKINHIYWNPYQFKEWRYNDALNSPLTFEETTKACIGTHRVKIFSGRIKAGTDPIDEWQGVSTYGSERFDYAQPTWCNVFARELSRIVFGRDAFPADKNCKALLNTEFSVKKDQYIELGGNNKTAEIIWNLINKGYPVYFVSEGHIETGFPDGYAYTSYRYRYEDDKRYDIGYYTEKENLNILKEQVNSDHNIVVGAGTMVGFKESWANYSWLRNSANIYLYLGYLKDKY